MGRGNYNETIQQIKYGELNLWPFARFIAFDSPLVNSHFEERYKKLLENISLSNPLLMNGTRILCTNGDKAREAINNILQENGEGIVLRKTFSEYEHGRSSSLYKLKAARGDAEALILDCAGDTILLQMPNGTEFEVSKPGNLDAKNGDVVSFSYESFTRGSQPTNVDILRVRSDLAWHDVLRNFFQEKSSRLLNDASQKDAQKSEVVNPKRIERIRLFLMNYSDKRNLDPLNPTTWYSIYSQVTSDKEAKSVIGNDYVKALLDAFPNIGLSEDKLNEVSNTWKSINSRRQLMTSFAIQQSIDPVDPSGWNSIPPLQYIKNKSVVSVLSKYYEGKLGAALPHLFPEIEYNDILLKNLFSLNDEKNFFFQFAESKKFDPLVAENWYSVYRKSIKEHKGALSVLVKYGYRFTDALLSIFPDIGLDLSKFKRISYWGNISNQREFFKIVAQDKFFDPLVSESWNNVSLQSIKSYKGGKSIMKIYENDIAAALNACFPGLNIKKYNKSESGLDIILGFAKNQNFDPLERDNWNSNVEPLFRKFKKSSFIFQKYGSLPVALNSLFPEIKIPNPLPKRPYNYWGNIENQRKFMENFARQQNFDPLSPLLWPLHLDSLLLFSEAKTILSYYNRDPIEALANIFPEIRRSSN